MGLIKPAGKHPTDLKHLKLHGSAPRRGLAKWGGQLQRLSEKPKGRGKK